MRILISISLIMGFLLPVMAQEAKNMALLSHWNDTSLANTNGRYFSDCWGYEAEGNEYAVIGSLEFVHFFAITEPGELTEVGRFAGGSLTGWREFKTYKDRLYAISDASTEGMMIFDLSHLPDSVVKTYHSTEFFEKAHMLFVDEPNGWLYITGSNTRNNGLIVLDISQNPDQPVLLASVELPGGNYVHDVYVRDNIAYCSHGNNGLYVWDFNDPQQPVLLASQVTGGYNHSTWMNKAGNILVNAEEIPRGLPLLLFDITKVKNNELNTLNAFRFPLLAPAHTDVTYHNPYFLGDYVITSAYEDGVHIFDVKDPLNPVHAAWYDTYPQNTEYTGYKGCWGVYPFLPSGRLVASDMQNGLFLLRPYFLDPEVNRKNTFKINPNPATNSIFLTITSDELINYDYYLYNAAGQLFRRGTLCGYGESANELDVSDIPVGLYLVRINITGAGQTPDLGASPGSLAYNRDETAFGWFIKNP